MLSSYNISQSGISNIAGLFSSTTKRLHQCTTSFLIMVTLHTSICGVYEQYVYNFPFYCQIKVCNVISVILISIILPSLLEFLLHLHI